MSPSAAIFPRSNAAPRTAGRDAPQRLRPQRLLCASRLAGIAIAFALTAPAGIPAATAEPGPAEPAFNEVIIDLPPPLESTQPQPAPKRDVAPRRAAPVPSALQPVRRPEEKAADAADTAPASEAEAAAEAAPPASAAQAAPGAEPSDAVPVQFVAGRSSQQFALRFDWAVPVSAAAYRRGGYVWVVFDRAERLSLARAHATGGEAAATLQQIPVALGTAARLQVGAGVYPRVRREGEAWIVELGPRPVVPAAEIPVLAEPRAPVEPRVLLQVKGAAEPLVVEDSTLSEQVFVVPVRDAGTGVGSDRVFPEFHLIATAQGIAVHGVADGVLVRRVREGVAITSTHGLVLSGREPERRDVRWPGDKSSSPRLIDSAAWRQDGESFVHAKQRLQSEVAVASESERGRHRLALAQFYFGHGFYADALGSLELARDQDKIGEGPAFRLLLGATALLTGDLDIAGKALMDPRLNGQAEAALWRGSLKSAQLDWPGASEAFRQGRGLLRFYEEPFRSRFMLQAARASLAQSEPDAALRYLDILLARDPSEAHLQEAAYLRGEILRAQGELPAALAQWQKVIEQAAPPTRVEATLARTEVLLEQGRISRPEAIAELETLRFAWRGDDVEFRILRRLADYYLAEEQYRLALSNLRLAADFYPDHPKAGALRGKLRRAFLDLFVEGKADSIAPVAALGIYDEFKELTPADSRGDAIVRRLAERLISVDLLESAATLLERQIETRLKGVERARTGARLAAVRVLDRKPQEALDALDRTYIEGLSEDLLMERNRLRARALAELDQLDEALDVIGADPGPETDLVRAVIYWRMKNWPGAAKALGRVAAQVSVVEGKLSDEDSKLILSWATALALSGDKQGLINLRRRFDHLMEESAYRDAYGVVANETDGEVTDYPSLVAKVREVAYYEGFMEDYRARLKHDRAVTRAAQPGPAASGS